MTITAWDGSNVIRIPIELYPNNEPLIRGPLPNIVRLCLQQTTLADFMAGLFMVDAMRARGLEAPHLLLPCPPGMRQDRVIDKPSADFLFTAKSVAEAINAREFPSVTILDPHSEAIVDMVHRCVPLGPEWWIRRAVPAFDPKWTCVISPDAGARRRAESVANALQLPCVRAHKTRDSTTGALSGFWVEPLPLGPQHCLIVDDLCDGGGTFLGLAEILRPHSADLYVTHGLFTKGTRDLAPAFTRIITTDSVPCRLLPGEIVPFVIPVVETLLKEGKLV